MKKILLVVLSVVALGCLLISFLYKTPVLDIPEGNVKGKFGGVSLSIELATTTADRELGLGDRESIPDRYGMLFAFPADSFYGFWMKDTLIPLDIFWLDDQGRVVSIKENALPESYPETFYPTEPARYVLETNAGFAHEHGIATGTPLVLQNFPIVLE